MDHKFQWVVREGLHLGMFCFICCRCVIVVLFFVQFFHHDYFVLLLCPDYCCLTSVNTQHTPIARPTQKPKIAKTWKSLKI